MEKFMSTTITFDTLAFTKRLKNAGVPEKQAEAQAEAQAEMLTEIFHDKVATKHDIQLLKHDIHELKRDIKEIRIEMEKLKSDILLKVGSMIAGAVLILPLVFKLTNQLGLL